LVKILGHALAPMWRFLAQVSRVFVMDPKMVNLGIFVIVLVVDWAWRVDAIRDCPAPGEPLWIVPEDLGLFFLARRRPNMVLNRQLPEITARDVWFHRAVRGFLIRSTRR
jgi:hypothetical protein